MFRLRSALKYLHFFIRASRHFPVLSAAAFAAKQFQVIEFPMDRGRTHQAESISSAPWTRCAVRLD
jgi:hypothetical protein